MRGRKPKPSYLRAIDGNAGRRPINADEPKPSGNLLEPPADLSAIAQRVWREAIAAAPEGMLSSLDRSAFQGWCVQFATFQEADAKVQSLGLLVKAPGEGGQPYQNPYLSVRNKAATLMRQFASDLGFNPTARTRVKITKPAKGSNPFDDLKSLTD